MKLTISLAMLASAAALVDTKGWTLLVKQDSRSGNFFPKGALAKTKGNYNTNHPNWKLYAHLNQRYDQFRGFDGKMELQLRYPELKVKTLTWKQASAPNSKVVKGYEIEENQQHDFDGRADFNGMSISSSGSTFLDGQTTHGNWWYAVGSSRAYGGGIPGPKGTQTKTTNTKVREVQLWVRNPEVTVTKEGWTLLVKQDSRTGIFFNKKMVKDGNQYEDNSNAHLYAHLTRDYTSFRGTDGKMTFQLRYPDLKGDKTLTWKQSSTPMTKTVLGFEIDVTQRNHWHGTASAFNGMAKSSSGSTLLDGQTTHPNWFYAVATTNAWRNGIPGPRLLDGKLVTGIKRAEFWVKNIEHSNPVNCKDWTCAEWCQFFDVDVESDGVYTAQGCGEDGGIACSC